MAHTAGLHVIEQARYLVITPSVAIPTMAHTAGFHVIEQARYLVITPSAEGKEAERSETQQTQQ